MRLPPAPSAGGAVGRGDPLDVRAGAVWTFVIGQSPRPGADPRRGRI